MQRSRLMVQVALDGVGLSHLLLCAVQEHIAAKRLVRVLADYCPPFPGYFPTIRVARTSRPS